MNIEEEFFQRTTFDFDLLKEYGFTLRNGMYIYETEIVKGSFKMTVFVLKNGICRTILWDKDFNEEFTNHRVQAMEGEYISNVRGEFYKELEKIKESCTHPKSFITPQMNRISKQIYERYGDSPEFIFERFPGIGIFRNKDTKKWYLVAIPVQKALVTKKKEEGKVEVIAIKLDKKKIPELLKKEGYYPAYHMNKISWISIIMDDTLSDDSILEHISESYEFSKKSAKK